ncbi:MAG: molybdopterin-dependent oxidoreductase, partial [Pyrinomonadaceae bacterium]
SWGNLEKRFTEQQHYRPAKSLSPIVANDPQRCILCKRCTRVCDEWMGEDAIEAGGRGAGTVIGTYGGWLDCSQCGNCIEVCPTGTLLDATYRHQARPWELAQTISTCSFCSDGCQMSLGARGGDLLRIVARDRYVNGLNGEFLCIKGRFGHPFVNHADRIRTPMIRYQKGGRLIPATWDDAILHVARSLDAIVDANGPNSLAVVGSPRLTNEALFALRKFATELVGTENYTATDAFSLRPFFENLGAALATHNDIRHAATILLLGGEPEELQPLTGKQVRQAVRNSRAKLIVVNSVPIRLVEQSSQFIHINEGSLDAAVLALHSPGSVHGAMEKMGVDAKEFATLQQTLANIQGDIVIMFSAELSPAAQTILAQLPFGLSGPGRVLLHPLPLYNNSIGAHDMGMMNGAMSAAQMLAATGEGIRAMYVAGSFLETQLETNPDALAKLDFLVVQELFETATTAHADVVFPAASFAEVDGTFTNNDGFVQRVRQSIAPVHSSRADWIITSQLANELGVDFGFELSASAVFRQIAATIPAYADLRYPLLKDESHPVQVKHTQVAQRDLSTELEQLKQLVSELPAEAGKQTVTPDVGHELFKPGTLTGRVPQFPLLAGGNPRPETLRISPLYQITKAIADFQLPGAD